MSEYWTPSTTSVVFEIWMEVAREKKGAVPEFGSQAMMSLLVPVP